jgi:hypothetical protein
MTSPDAFELPAIEAWGFERVPGMFDYWNIEVPMRNPIDPSQFNYVSCFSANSTLRCLEACKKAQRELFDDTKRFCLILLKYEDERIYYDSADDDMTLELLLRFS